MSTALKLVTAMGRPIKIRETETPEQRERRLTKARKYRHRQTEKWLLTNRAYSKKWYQENKAKARAYANVRKYGLTVQEYAELFAKQNGVCAVCRQPETLMRKSGVARLSIDHRHVDGMIRGLLCTNCNNGLGRFNDDPARLRAAADYLEKAK